MELIVTQPSRSFASPMLAGILSVLVAATAWAAPAPTVTSWPTTEWEVATPESVGLDSAKLKLTSIQPWTWSLW